MVEAVSDGATVARFRSVGRAERDRIAGRGFRVLSPRLAHQSIFYPVLNEAAGRSPAHRARWARLLSAAASSESPDG